MFCIVTGGAGFIGSHIVDALVAAGDKVLVIDDFSAGSEKNLAHHQAGGQVTYIRQNLLDDGWQERFWADRVYHIG